MTADNELKPSGHLNQPNTQTQKRHKITKLHRKPQSTKHTDTKLQNYTEKLNQPNTQTQKRHKITKLHRKTQSTKHTDTLDTKKRTITTVVFTFFVCDVRTYVLT